jgi:hypothetical protein
MRTLWPKVNPASPAIARRARRYEVKLRRALALAAKRSPRDPVLAVLYGSAEVEGLDSRLMMKKAAVTFTERPFRGGLHQIYDWRTLDELSERELADGISWSLRESLRERAR